MNVSLGEKWEAYVAEKVQSGRYLSASEVIRESLRLLEEQELLRANQLEHLRSELELGIAQLNSGQFMTFENGDALRKHLTAQLDVRMKEDSRKAVNG